MKLTLAGHSWTALSPSMFTLDHYPVALVYNSRAWYLSFDGSFANARPWPSRDEAAQAIADAFTAHQMREMML